MTALSVMSCPSCQTHMQIPEGTAPGSQIACPSCKTVVAVPNAPGAIEMNATMAPAPTGKPGTLLYRQVASKQMETCLLLEGVLCCNIPLCCKAGEIRRRSYVDVYNNKLEWNSPYISPCSCLCFCCPVIDDYVNVMYYDRAFFNSPPQKAGCCMPLCELCPTCFDICGEAIVLKPTGCCIPPKKMAQVPLRMVDPSMALLCCCPILGLFACCMKCTTVFIPGYDNAQNLANQIYSASKAAREGGYAAPPAVSMV